MTKTRKSSAAALKIEPRQLLQLAQFRRGLRKVLADSEEICVEAGLTSQRFQAMLAIASVNEAMSVGDLAAELMLKHHSCVELVDRLAQAGLIARVADAQDKRRVLLSLTSKGVQALNHLAAEHLAQLDDARGEIMRGLGLEPLSN